MEHMCAAQEYDGSSENISILRNIYYYARDLRRAVGRARYVHAATYQAHVASEISSLADRLGQNEAIEARVRAAIYAGVICGAADCKVVNLSEISAKSA